MVQVFNLGSVRGPQGEQGIQGPAGAQGEIGPQGEKGADGEAATIEVGTVTTLPPESEAAVTNSGTSSAAVFDFAIPRGENGSTLVSFVRTSGTGAPGTTDTYTGTMSDGTTFTITVYNGTNGDGSGDMVKSVYDTNNNGIVDNAEKLNGKADTEFANAVHDHMASQVKFSDNETFQEKYDNGDLTGPQGQQGVQGVPGEDGEAATIAVGTVATGAAGSSVQVINRGTPSAAVFDFTIPKGDKGDTGANGINGTAATISIGTVTTGAAGSTAQVTNSGTENAAVLNFVIPQGEKGNTGTQGETGPNEVSTTTATNISGILKGNGSNVSAATAGTDYVAPSALGAAGGIATLDSNIKVTPAQTSARIITISSSTSLSATHAGCLVGSTATGAITVTISSGLAEGTEIEVMNYGGGAVTVSPASGVTLNGGSNSFTISNQYTSGVLKCVASNTWVIQGAIE